MRPGPFNTSSMVYIEIIIYFSSFEFKYGDNCLFFENRKMCCEDDDYYFIWAISSRTLDTIFIILWYYYYILSHYSASIHVSISLLFSYKIIQFFLLLYMPTHWADIHFTCWSKKNDSLIIKKVYFRENGQHVLLHRNTIFMEAIFFTSIL